MTTTWTYSTAADHGLTFKERNRSLACERGLVRQALQGASWGLLQGYLRLVHRLQVQGTDTLPHRGSFVVVANHSSHLDALVLGAALAPHVEERPHLLAAGDTFFSGPFKAACSSLFLNALPVWRNACPRRALAELRAKLVAPESRTVLVLFPEGTRSRSGRLGKFKAGIGALVAGTGVPVVPAGISGAHEAWPAGQSLPQKGRLKLALGRPRLFADEIDDRTGWENVAATLRNDVSLLREAPETTRPESPSGEMGPFWHAADPLRR